ncbi:protein PLASTID TRANSCRIPTIONALLY ACTIVE 16, chloroplastic [Magnolia sinica]|uniref:protein PLASTID TRANSCRIPTIONALLY ACTIVE 16, chloroplastic n=1 Tax=Magnolia sinica TaxID=86752 RepID=UPI00265A5B9F|nr:protein PLASTID TRANSCRIPTIONALLY ACTIVE 16, chloroplastic [Magnolia sinica]
MASTLTSNSFLTTTPRSRLAVKSRKPGRPIFAKFNFRIGKRDSGSSSTDDENQSTESDKRKKPFFFDFGKIPDMKSLVPVVSQPSTALSFGNSRRKDPRTVFIAGATGQFGIRIVPTLLRQGFAVRAGVPELSSAQELARLAAKYKIISSDESRRFNAVQSAFQDPESIAKAIGNASKVVITIGPFENGPTSEVTTSDALQVIQGAQLAGVGHVAVIYNANSTSMGSTYNVLDGITSFFNNFFSRSQSLTLTEFLAKVVETDVSYTLIKASLTEEYSTEYSNNVVLKAEGATTDNEYKVSKSQIASLVAGVFANTSVAENKVVEVSTNPSVPSKPIDELFSAIPEDGRRKAYAEALAKAKAEEEALRASEKAREAEAATKKLEEEVKKLSEQEAQATSLAEEAREKAEAAGSSLEGLVNRAKGLGSGFSWEKLSSQIATAVSEKDDDEKPKVQIATVRGQAKARTLMPKKAVVKPPPLQKPKTKPAEPKPEVRKVFGGLFKQETIYMDDD